MKEPDNTDELLLYWSGELDPGEKQKIEGRLAADTEARTYLEELDFLRTKFDSLPAPPVERTPAESAVQDFHSPRKSLGAPLRWLAAAAAVALTAFLLVQLVDRKPSRPSPVVEKNRGNVLKANPEMERTLSSQLFANKTRFSSPDRSSSPRERVRRFRTYIESTRS